MPQSMGEIEYEHNPKHQERLPKKKERKWTLGSLFRRKKVKESDSESSDSDAVEDGKKGGFLARRRRRRRSANRGSKDVSQSFEHVILRPGPGNISSDSSRKSLKARVEANRDSMLKGSSSEEECSPRPRVPRSKRSSRDMTDCSIKVLELDSSPRSPRWTAKVVYCESSDYEARYTAHTRSATPSPAQSPVAKVKHFKRPPIPQANQPRPLHCQKSASFDILPRQTQLYNSHGLQPQLRVPPPPPPRDPQRKIIPPLGYQQDRPLSYAFESNQPTQKILTDHNSNITSYKVNSTQSLDQPVYKVNSSGSLDQRRMYQYYTDQQPRSRRPIHIARIDQPYLSDSQVGRIRPNDWRLPSHSNSSLCDSSDSREGSNNVNDVRPLSMVVETLEQPLPSKRQSQEILSNGFNKSEQKRKSSNLEDALNELEAIYKSLQLRDEDPPSRGFESDSGYSYRVLDDMAYRRLNRKESGGSPDCRAVMSQAGSYLLVSPTLSPPPFANASPVITQPQNEPDITLDDVVYRNIRHSNNTLKINDPQPPFGIPLGPITPAPNSDYLHATPKQLYRPTFKPRKTPDVVKDDLAYRNLRKDSQNDSLLTCEDNFLGSTNDNSSVLKKKRAVRSLSANLLSIIQKEHFNLDNQNSHINHNYNNGINFEKTQSFTDLPEVLNSRYKRNSSNAEDSDVTPRVSRLYNELPVSTTSTETLTDSRANIMNIHESFLNGKPSQPINNKSLPKTDYLNQRLPNSHEISSPNKFLQNVQHDNNNEFSVRNSSVEKYMQQFSSPNNSLKFNSYLTQPESSKPQSSYHSDSNILFSNCKERDYQLPYDYVKDNSVPTRIGNDNLITYDRDYLRRKEKERFSQVSYDNDKYFSDDNYNKFIRYGSHDSSDQRIPKVFDHNVNDIRYNSDCDSLRKSIKSNVNSPSSSFTKKINDAISNSSFDVKLSIPYLCKPIERDNPSILMTSTEASKSGNHVQTTKGDKVLKKESNSGVKDVSKKPSVNSSTKNRISIEGIKIEALPSSKNKSLAKNKFSSLPDEKVQKSGESSTSSLNKSKPKMSHSHEKSHQKIDASVNINQNKINNKVVVPRPRSTINITNENSLSVDKNKTTSPNLRLSVTPENESNKKQIPSPRLNLSDKEIKSKSKSPSSSSSSPRLTVRSSSLESNINGGNTKKSSPRISITPEKSPGRTTSESDAGTTKEKDKSVTDSSDRSNRVLKNSSNDKKKRKILSKSLSLNDGLIREINDNDDMKTCIPEIVLDEPSNTEVSSDISYGFISNDNNKITDTKSVHDKESDEVKPNSNVISISTQNESSKNLQQSRVEKDLNELITEIHHKQDEILAGSKALSNSPENTSENLLIGKMKITPHKPVKLTTFSINDNNNTIENNETIIVSDYKENDIIGTSESMTDLLRELTRSLDQDFGILTSNCNTNDDDNNEDNDVNNDNESVDIDKITNKNITDNEQDVTDEADIEVMEINRKVLSEIEKQNDDKSKDLNKINDNINYNEKSIIDSDDSNMEFVEEICKTASEISALSSTATKSSSQPTTNETSNSLMMMDKLRIWNQQPSTSTSNLVDQQNKEDEENSTCGMVHVYGTSVGVSEARSIDMSDDVRQQRMAKYKEERRRQLAAQFGRRDVSISDVSDPAYGIRSTRASRLRSAAASANNDSTLSGGSITNRYASKRDPGGQNPTTPPTRSQTLGPTPSDTAKEKSPPLVPSNNSGSPRREKDKSSKRKSNLNRQLNAEEVHNDMAPADDGVRRRRARMVSPSLSTSNSSKNLSSRTSASHIPTNSNLNVATKQSSSRQISINSSTGTESPSLKRITPPKKLSDRSNSLSTASSDSSSTKVTSATTLTGTSATTTASSAVHSTPPPPSSRIPKKVISSPSLLSSSSRESSPRNNTSTHRLSLGSTSTPLSMSPAVINVSNGTNSPVVNSTENQSPIPSPISHSSVHINGHSNIISNNHFHAVSNYNRKNSNENVEVIEISQRSNTTNEVTNNVAADNFSSLNHHHHASRSLSLKSVSQFLNQQPSSNARPSLLRPYIPFKKKAAIASDDSTSSTSNNSAGNTTVLQNMPVSILKRKTSQEEGGSSSSSASGVSSAPPPPVTFSPSVVDPIPGRRQGILKKHRSLDESEVTRRRSCSPDVDANEFRPILKHQRRSSLEELHRRTQSPEPQSILKRKTSREEGVEASSTSEPHGILKRKTSTSSNEPPSSHVTIADSVILAITGGIPTTSTDDHVKPILKKKSFSGEEAPSEIVNSSETPRPILKKKSSSVETDEVDEKHHVKPILKLRKDSIVSSAFAHVSTLRQESKLNDVSSNEDSVHVLLNTVSDHEFETASSVGSSSIVEVIKKTESEPYNNVDNSLSPCRLNKSLIWQNNSFTPTNNTNKRHSLAIVTSRDEDDTSPRRIRAGSVLERVMNMESFLASEGYSDCSSSSLPSSAGAVPKRVRDKDRFRTQPITAQEINKSISLVPDKSERVNVSETNSQEQSLGGSVAGKLSEDTDNNSCSSPTFDQSPDSSCIQRSDSVSAKAILFNQLEAQMKLAAEEARNRRLNRGINRNLKIDGQSSRFATQPVTFDEVEEAKKQNTSNLSGTTNMKDSTNSVDSDGNHPACGDDEFDPSKLSLAERVKLFNKNVNEDKVPKERITNVTRRSSRFKTQPVTTKDFTTAQEITSKSVATTLSRTASGILVSGLLKNLAEKGGAKSPSLTDIKRAATSDNDVNKNDSENEDIAATNNENSISNKKGILKQKTNSQRSSVHKSRKDNSEFEGMLHLKSVLKKETSTSFNSVNQNINHSSDLHSILKSSSIKKDESLSDETSDSTNDDDDEDDDDASNNEIKDRKINKNLDIVNLLHKVEADAKINSSNELNNLKSDTINNCDNLTNLSDSSHKPRSRKKYIAGEETSEGDTSSSGGREIRKIIGNDAVARRRHAAIAKQAADRVKASSQTLSKSHSQSTIGAEDENMVNGGGETSVVGGLRRCLTQPMPPACDTVDEPLTIAQRLAALQKSGESDWRKRMSKLGIEDELPSININDAQQILKQQLVGSDTSPLARPPVAPSVITKSSSSSTISSVIPSPTNGNGSALAERLGRLQTATHGWKKRVEPSDAVQFSVAGRMALSPTTGSTPITSPVTERKKKPPRPTRFRSKNRSSKEVQSTPTSPEAEDTICRSRSLVFKRSVSAPSGDEDSSLSPVENDGDEDENDDAFQVRGPRVTVPKELDENFSEFFSSADNLVNSKSIERLEIKDEDLEQVKCESRQILVQARRVKVQRRHEASGNPLKLLAARKDLRSDYVEVRSDYAQKEVKRINVEKLSKNSSLAVEALAGLASKEDFTSVSLRKANSSQPAATSGSWLPYKDLMLLHIKGRRHVQTRLVNPHYTSVNQGDSYVLVTPTEIYHWMGEFSNVIEKSRSCEVAQHILQKKDLGCKASSIVTLHSGVTNYNHAKFWKLLGANDEIAETFTGKIAGHPDEDELYESALIDTNMMYYVEDEELVPIQKCWGTLPRIEILSPAKIIVFDFGTELYVWMGKNATMDKRKSALQLTEELWSHGYDYTECDICPVTAAQQQGSDSSITEKVKEEKKGVRPSWGLIAKVTQHMETVLFREKFLDWPDFSRVIRTKRKSSKNSTGDASIKVKPCDVQEFLNWQPPPGNLHLEGNHLGRGRTYFDEETRRNYEVTTKSVNVWHIEEFTSTELPEDSRGQFYSGDSYVVRWLYSITVSGRELSGQPSKHAVVGRDRCAYFIWQGSGATLNDQGAAALITVQLDVERGPQIRIPQGSEPPAFLSLFQGTAAIHKGKRGQPRTTTDWRLYICRGEEPQEAVFVEVSCSIRSLRSRASFLLTNLSTGHVYLWHGAKTLQHTRQVASQAVDKLTDGDMADFGLGRFDEVGFSEIEEGSEPKEFFQGIGGCKRHLYVSLENSKSSYNWTPQLIHLSTMLGQFIATPVIPPCSHPTLDCPFPYTQEDLYSASQPALFLLNSQDIVWLWQGWVPPDESTSSDAEDQEEASLSSLSMINQGATVRNSIRWQAERKAAMGTALQLWHLKHGDTSTPQVYLACAGLEPLEFTNLFPAWTDRDDIAEINIKDGRKPGELLNVEEELARLTRSTYPIAQLLQRPLPEGVDPTQLEIYLSPQDFQELLGMSKEQFNELPAWKQTNLKKSAGLF